MQETFGHPGTLQPGLGNFHGSVYLWGMSEELDKVYIHLSNSGTTFEVIDEGHGPTISVSSSAFGNLQHEFKVHTDRETLRLLGNMFLSAAQRTYSPEYCLYASAVEKPGQSTSGDEQQSDQKRPSTP